MALCQKETFFVSKNRMVNFSTQLIIDPKKSKLFISSSFD